jgi:phage baseplate assembly protein W
MAVVSRADRTSLIKRKEIVYRDFLPSVLFNDDTNDLNLIENEDSVKQSIINILLTNTGERVFNPNFGSEINKMLFENITPQTSSTLTSLIKAAIENFEPRAQLHEVQCTPSPDENAYAVTVVFSTINRTEPITLDFLLNRVR